jgi:hypothetical protein
MQIVYQDQLLNVPQWKLTSDALTFLVKLSSYTCCKNVLSKIIHADGHGLIKRQLALSNYYEIEIDLFSVSVPYTTIPWKRKYDAHRPGSMISPCLWKYGFTTSGGVQFNQKCLGV